jgi:hypothetical protein
MWKSIQTSCAVLLSAALILWGTYGAVSGSGTITILDSTGTTQTYAVVTDGSGHFIAVHVLCDFAAGANCASVNSSHQVLTLDANSAAALTNQSTMITSLATIATNSGAAIPAGTNLIGKVGIDQTTPGTTNLVALAANQSVNTAQVNGITTLTGTGATGTGSQRVTIAGDTATFAGSSPSVTLNVINGGSVYNTIAASQTTQALTGGSGGATGDYLSHCVVIPTTTSPGVVTIIDNATTVYAFPGGASSLSNLVPFAIPIGSKSVSGAWKVTTGAGLSVVCTGKFT